MASDGAKRVAKIFDAMVDLLLARCGIHSTRKSLKTDSEQAIKFRNALSEMIDEEYTRKDECRKP